MPRILFFFFFSLAEAACSSFSIGLCSTTSFFDDRVLRESTSFSASDTSTAIDLGLDFMGDFRAAFDFLMGAGAESSSSELESTDALVFARAFEESFEGYEARMISGLRLM